MGKYGTTLDAFDMDSRIRPATTLTDRMPLYVRGKSMRGRFGRSNVGF